MSGEGWPSGTVTFLFTDIEASTRRWREDESVMVDALRAHDAVLGSAVESHGGVAFKHTGDGVVAVFDSAVAAVAAAVVAQSDLGLPVRMGLHTGEAELRDGDYFGTALNRAARIMDAGNGGQVLVSEATTALLGDVELVDLGDYVLKGFDGSERIFQVGVGLFPALRARQAVVGNLPREMTGLVGRTDDLDEVVATVSEHRLVTLFGVGGIGKTRLALAVAGSMAGEFDRGGWLVELGQIAVPEAVPLAVMNGVGIQASPGGDVVEDLIERLRDEQMLVVVDNCEHLLDAVAVVVARLVAECPGVKILATSREPLMVPGERVVAVGSLPAEDAMALFVDRAMAEAPDFELDDRQRQAVSALCDRLDGLPLAIELAAARVRSFTPVDLLDGLSERFRLLSGSRRARIERHQTMRAALDWSYELCDQFDRLVFDSLSVFPFEFDMVAAGSVAAAGQVSEFDVVDAVTRLVDRSLLQAGTGRDGTARYRMLETMRAYGREHLGERGESDAARDRHARFVSDTLDQLTRVLLGPDESETFARVGELLPDGLAALDWFIDHQDWNQAMRVVAGFALPRDRELHEMVSRLRAAIASVGTDVELTSELDAATWSDTGNVDIGRFWEIGWRDLDTIRIFEGRDSYPSLLLLDVARNLNGARNLTSEQANRLVRATRAYRAARPITRYRVERVSCRQLVFNGYNELAQSLLVDVEKFAEDLDSNLVRASAIEIRGLIEGQNRNWGQAAIHLWRAVELRTNITGLALSFHTLLISWHAVVASSLSGNPPSPAALLQPWDTYHELGARVALMRGATATAVALSQLGHQDLAARFVNLAHRNVDPDLLALVADELDLAGLHPDPDRPPDTLESLLDELRALDNPTTPSQHQS